MQTSRRTRLRPFRAARAGHKICERHARSSSLPCSTNGITWWTIGCRPWCCRGQQSGCRKSLTNSIVRSRRGIGVRGYVEDVCDELVHRLAARRGCAANLFDESVVRPNGQLRHAGTVVGMHTSGDARTPGRARLRARWLSPGVGRIRLGAGSSSRCRSRPIPDDGRADRCRVRPDQTAPHRPLRTLRR